MIRKFSFLPVLLVFIIPTRGHSQLLQGEWRDHLSYSTCYSIADMGEWIYCSAQTGLISYNTDSHALRKHSKVTGLSDVIISTIAYSAETHFLIVGYANGNIDLLREGESPMNLSDIKRKIITADKRIYNIYVDGQYAYLSCGFGIVVLNLDRMEIKETYILGENGTYVRINDLTIDGNFIYAATELGILSANLNSDNLLDYNNWHRLEFVPQAETEYKLIEKFQNQLFAVYRNQATQHDQIITFGENSYQSWGGEYDSVVNNINSANGFLTISSPKRGLVYSQNNQLYMDFENSGNRQIYVSPDNQIFVASTYTGFSIRNDINSQKYLTIDGPRYGEVSKVATSGDQVWVSTGGPLSPWVRGAVYSYIDGKWNSYLAAKIPTSEDISNTYKIAIDPRDPSHVFVTSYIYALIEFRNGAVYKTYEKESEHLFDDIRAAVGLRISGIQFDKQGNLWMVMSLVPQSLFKIDTDGNWSRPSVPTNTILNQERTGYADLLVTSHDQIWILSNSSDVVVLKNDGSGYFDSKSFKVKNQYGNQLTLGYCLDEDNEGNIWVGTNNGPIVYYAPWNIFYTDDVSGYQIPIPRNDGTNNVDLLLYNESVFDIKTDGGNRKWLATDNSGVFLISPDGRESILNFRDDNSPLLSNSISGIGINEKSGEVFFATGQGLVSYGGNATKGFTDYSDVYVYPNPVRPEYEGVITITGLIENSIVKITDVSGNLVWETKSLGGQAIWDGHNFDGRKVASGVYLVMLSTEDGLKSHIIKLLFLH